MTVREQWSRLQQQVCLSHVQQQLCNLVDRVWHGEVVLGPIDGQDWAPLVDLVDQEDGFLLKAELPGVDIAQIEVRVEGRALVIRGQKSRDVPEPPAGHWLRCERRFGKFCRRLELPAEVKADQIVANYSKGVLTVRLPKEQVQPAAKVHVEQLD